MMIKYINKYFQVIFLALFTLIAPLYCSPQSWYNSIISEKRLYGKTVSVIDFAMAIRTKIAKLIMANNPDKFITSQKNKLVLIEKNIREAQQKQIYEIAKKNNLDDVDIKITLEVLTKIILCYKESHNTPNSNVIHDKEISSENFTVLKKMLSQEGIDINNISLINGSAISYQGHRVTARNEHIYSVSYGMDENGNISTTYSNRKPINITFYPEFHLCNKLHQQAACIHEATHLIEGHVIIEGVTPIIIGTVAQKDPNDISESEDFQKLLQINERQAEVFPSLKDKEVASLMRKHRSVAYYPDRLYGQHYFQLSDIDETHKIIAYLESINRQNNL